MKKMTWLLAVLLTVALLPLAGVAEAVHTPAQQAFLDKIDPAYGLGLIERLLEIRSNEDLGYRTAGSAAELAAGDLLAAEMRDIGLQDVTKDRITLDTWTFERANLSFTAADGSEYDAILGGYQTQFETEGFVPFSLVYAGQGTEADLEGLDVGGKLVLLDINQRDNWWVNYPAYEAHLRGAAAVLVAQDGGYSEISDDALNAQDICGPADAPAFSISRKDAAALQEALAASADGEITVRFDAMSTVGFGGESYNIVGSIPGRDPEKMVLMSAHYDAYFDGFQDDTAAIALMMGIAKALVDSGYQPEKTLVFCALAAEEWGVSNTRYDWSTGAYNQIFRVRPEWAGKVVADINFELPAYTLDYDTSEIRASYELLTFLEAFAQDVPAVEGVYPKGVEVIVPTQTWSDDFSFSIAGIPATVNSLREDFAKLYYHSQFDDRETYSEPAFAHAHGLYGLLMMAYDYCAVAPLDFTTRMNTLTWTIDSELMAACGVDAAPLGDAADAAKEAAIAAYARVSAVNDAYREALEAGEFDTADQLLAETGSLYAGVLAAFKAAEDGLVRLTWEDVSVFPHELPAANLAMLLPALEAIESGDPLKAADDYLWAVDNNWYAYDWSYDTYRYFTDYVLEQPADRLMWGAGRTVGHEDLFHVIRGLYEKADQEGADYSEEIEALGASIARQKEWLVQMVDEEIATLENLTALLKAL